MNSHNRRSIRTVRRTIDSGSDSFRLRTLLRLPTPASAEAEPARREPAAPAPEAAQTSAEPLLAKSGKPVPWDPLAEAPVAEGPAPEESVPDEPLAEDPLPEEQAPADLLPEKQAPADLLPEKQVPQQSRAEEPTLEQPLPRAPLAAAPTVQGPAGEAWDSLYSRSRNPKRSERGRHGRSRAFRPAGPARAWARRTFAALAILGFAFYWIGPGLALRPHRVAMFARSVEWWRGIRGQMLTHHRPGMQVAYIDPQSAQIFAVWDAQSDADLVGRALKLLPEGHWAVVSVLRTGDQPTVDRLRDLLQDSGWTEPIPAQGAAIAVFGHSAQEGELTLLARQVEQAPDAYLTLPRGLHGEDGTRLTSEFPIHVQE